MEKPSFYDSKFYLRERDQLFELVREEYCPEFHGWYSFQWEPEGYTHTIIKIDPYILWYTKNLVRTKEPMETINYIPIDTETGLLCMRKLENFLEDYFDILLQIKYVKKSRCRMLKVNKYQYVYLIKDDCSFEVINHRQNGKYERIDLANHGVSIYRSDESIAYGIPISEEDYENIREFVFSKLLEIYGILAAKFVEMRGRVVEGKIRINGSLD